MIKLSNGVELSEDTVISALKKSGISVEPKPKKHIFKAGDVVETRWTGDRGRIIVHTYNNNLISIDRYGNQCGTDIDGNGRFRNCNYTYIGRLSDIMS